MKKLDHPVGSFFIVDLLGKEHSFPYEISFFFYGEGVGDVLSVVPL